MNPPVEPAEIQRRLILAILVAGKSADFAEKALWNFLSAVASTCGGDAQDEPFKLLRRLTPTQLDECARFARTGNYGKICRAIRDLLATKLDLLKCPPQDLEKIHGIGPKTSRFFIMWIRPDERYAALDVHVLRWLRALPHIGVRVPKSTPQSSEKYALLERLFIAEADRLGKTPRQLDIEIWEAGAGRTQQAALQNA